MSVWELKFKPPITYRGSDTLYMVTTIDPKDKDAEKILAMEFNGASEFHKFEKSIENAKCIATMNPDSVGGLRGAYSKEELKREVPSFKEAFEIEATA